MTLQDVVEKFRPRIEVLAQEMVADLVQAALSEVVPTAFQNKGTVPLSEPKPDKRSQIGKRRIGQKLSPRQEALLLFIRSQKGPVSEEVVAKKFKISTTTASRHINRLIAKHYLMETPLPSQDKKPKKRGRAKRDDLTPREGKVLDWIKDQGKLVTTDQIATGLDLTKTTAYHHIKNLKRKRYLKMMREGKTFYWQPI